MTLYLLKFSKKRITDHNISDFYSTAILYPKNDNCTTINNFVISNLLPNDTKIYINCDFIQWESKYGQLYLVEFLNSLNTSGMPSHKLLLKKM